MSSPDSPPPGPEQQLAKCVLLAINNLRAPGSGLLLMDGKMQNWKHHFADALEMLPGVKIDRDAMMALDLPKKEFAKWKTERAKRHAEKAKG